MLAAAIAVFVVLRAAAIEIWDSSEMATLHYRQALDAIAQDERLVLEATRSVHYMLFDGPNLKLGESAVSELAALPPGQISFVDDFPLSPPLTLYKAASLESSPSVSTIPSENTRQQIRIAARLMWFEAAWGGSSAIRQPAYYVSADGKLAIARTSVEPSPLNAGMADASRYLDAMRERFSTIVASAPQARPLPYWTRPYVHPVSREDTITVFAPVRGPRNDLLGYIAKDFSLETFHEADKAITPLSIGYAFFSRDLDYAFGHQDDVLRRALRVPKFQHVLEAGDTAISWRDGVLLIGDTSPSDSWRVAFSLSFGQILSHHRGTAYGALIGFIFITVLTLIAALFVYRRLLEPVERQAKALAESEKFSRSIFEVTPVGLIAIELDHFRVLGRNDPARAMVNERTLDDLHEPGKISVADIARAFHGLSQEWVEVATNDAEPDRRYFTLRFATTSYRAQSVVLCAIVDVTHRRLTEESLAAAKHEAEAANAGKSAFLATISHEIRTPLHGTLAALELMSASKLDDDQRTLVDMMDGSARNLLQLINDLLDFSKLGAGQLTLQERPFNLTDELQQLIRTFAPRAVERGVRLRCFVSPDFERDVVGDPVRLSQIVANLVSNALKFTAHGHIDLIAETLPVAKTATHAASASASVSADAAMPSQPSADACFCPVRLTVIDTGSGIRPEQLSRLFTPFYQAHADSVTVQSGTGLGLSIVRELAALMHGESDVASRYGEGSEFTVRLPLRWAADTPVNRGDHLPLRAMTVKVFAGDNVEARFLERWLRSQAAAPIMAPLSDDVTQATGTAPSMAHTADVSAICLYAPGMALPPEPIQHPCVVMDPLGSPRPLTRGKVIRVSAYSQYGLLLALCEAAGRALPSRETLEVVADTSYGLRVLIVEDHPVNRRLLARQVERFGCETVVAPDGQQALQIVAEDGGIDLILTDINMPGMNGYQLAQAIRDRGYEMPIYGVTADVVNQNEAPTADTMQGCLPKPLSLAILGPVLRLVAVGRRPTRTMQRTESDNVTVATEHHDEAPLVADDLDTVPDELRQMVVETMDADVDTLENALQEASQNVISAWRDDIDGTLHRMHGATLALDWSKMTTLIRDAEGRLSIDQDDLSGVSDVISHWYRTRRHWLSSQVSPAQ